MNNEYVKIFFFVLILFACLNDKVLTTEYVAENAASYEPSRPKTIRIKITLSKTIPTLENISETSASETVRPRKRRHKRIRSKKIPYDPSSPETTLSRTPQYKTTPFNAVLSKTAPSKTVPSKTAPYEAAPSEAILTNPSSPPIPYTPTSSKSDRIYKKNKHLLCTNPAETDKATSVMDEAVNLLKYYATTNNGFKYYSTTNSGINIYYRNNGNGSSIEKCQFEISNPDKYDDIINILWDPNGPRKFDPSFIHGKVARSYNRNLLMVLKFYRNNMLLSERYFYALAKKAHISEDTTIIVMSSGNVNDHNPSSKKGYANRVLGSINSFKTSVDFDNDVMSGYYKRSFVNLSGYLIKKENNHVNVTIVSSMDFNAMIPFKTFTRDANVEMLLNILPIQRYFNSK
ncbi:fam-a protein [Plasmodium vinckei brucechwatti]|uniref:Fam-a protein n=1 Tax=Plasmodium vinckei brucechwatti TaxID=119398 RepID=A0A6V7S0F9_PLAVN|nr:fam-a protein [Plasmodium vinckei brucechwatti]